MIDLAGIGNLLEYLVAVDNITCEERDRIILRIAKKNDIAEYTLSALAGYGKSKSEVLECVARRKNSVPQDKIQDESYISLTENCSCTQRGRSRICDPKLVAKWKHISFPQPVGTGK